MVDVSERAVAVAASASASASASWAGGEERRRPGRVADVSPALVALMRQPASRSARVRVALYDAPGFLLPEAGSVRRPRDAGYLLRAGAVATGLAAGCTGMIEVMCWAWG